MFMRDIYNEYPSLCENLRSMGEQGSQSIR